MNKGLEALERVKKAHYVASIVMQLPHEDTETIQALNTIEKELKALEIIKNKEVDIKAFNDLQDLEDYNYYCSPELTQEEYNLIKEVLQCNTLKN